jgi:hypothetical protein
VRLISLIIFCHFGHLFASRQGKKMTLSKINPNDRSGNTINLSQEGREFVITIVLLLCHKFQFLGLLIIIPPINFPCLRE